jgi:hypothetical protein
MIGCAVLLLILSVVQQNCVQVRKLKFQIDQGHFITEAPQNEPDLMVTPEANPQFRAYSENTTITAMCTVRDARPAASLQWFMGELLFYPFLSKQVTRYTH